MASVALRSRAIAHLLIYDRERPRDTFVKFSSRLALGSASRRPSSLPFPPLRELRSSSAEEKRADEGPSGDDEEEEGEPNESSRDNAITLSSLSFSRSLSLSLSFSLSDVSLARAVDR